MCRRFSEQATRNGNWNGSSGDQIAGGHHYSGISGDQTTTLVARTVSPTTGPPTPVTEPLTLVVGVSASMTGHSALVVGAAAPMTRHPAPVIRMVSPVIKSRHLKIVHKIFYFQTKRAIIRLLKIFYFKTNGALLYPLIYHIMDWKRFLQPWRSEWCL